ncbi:cation-translocating P-type ATPase [Streptomyces sp. V3I7]|uniref:cation-translocating P-type ATPase n=1 Tax=Streptomyces sp. V3I7 TaxID=3042278 RepID=UPI002789E5D7|nr:cation-translocating P-type ATPase [Streptomyces sp. V3I7]MDQ0994614.1 cation-transporting ATPase I [Streptomyces sp. V3I7]
MRLAAIVPQLVGLVSAPVETTQAAAREGAGLLARLGRAAWAALSDLPSDLTEAAAALADSSTGRQRRKVWAESGRAHIEVRGLSGPEATPGGPRPAAVVRELSALEGVAWAKVNAAWGQVVVSYDESLVSLDVLLRAVEESEQQHGTGDQAFPRDLSVLPFETGPASWARVSLLADCAGIALAASRRVGPLSALPVPVVLTESNPRLRRMLENRLGRPQSDLVLSLAGAVVHSLAQGWAPLALDAVQRTLQLGEISERLAVWRQREAELVGDGDGLAAQRAGLLPRPVPLPDGPVETCADRTSAASVAASAGWAAWTHDMAGAARAFLATPPKAARMGREAFCARLGRDLARAGIVCMDDQVLRRLDRVTTVVIDAPALLTQRPRLLSVQLARGGDLGELWRAAQDVLAGCAPDDLAGPGPWERDGWRLQRPVRSGESGPDDPSGLELDVYDPYDRHLGRVLVSCDLDPLAHAVVEVAGSPDVRLHLTDHVAVAELLPWASTVLPSGERTLSETVRDLQAEGEVVLLVSRTDAEALAYADVGVAVPTAAGNGTAHWSAGLVCRPHLSGLWRILDATHTARSVSTRSAHLAVGGSGLGALVAAVGATTAPGILSLSPVYGAAFMAQWSGAGAARRLANKPLPPERLHIAWHALDTRQTVARLTTLGAFDAPPPALPENAAPPFLAGIGRWPGEGMRRAAEATGLTGAARVTGELARAVRDDLRDPLTPVLGFGAVASAVVGSRIDSALVCSVMAGNAVLSGAQRMHADRSLRGLLFAEQPTAQRLDPATVRAARLHRPDTFDGVDRETVTADGLSVGDVIAVGPSTVVPADARLLSCTALEVDEASLTGESVPITKAVDATPGAPLAERTCMLYEGCTVVTGSGYAVVVATGAQTEAGRAAELAKSASAPAGLERHLADLTRIALPAAGIGGAIVSALGLLRGLPVREALASGVAVAVAAVPEGLPLVATVAQTAAARRLSHKGILAKSARSLEALGRVDVICYDKTGTLTEGRLAVTRIATLDHTVAPHSPVGRHTLRVAARACPGEPEPDAVRHVHATDQAVLDAVADHTPDDSWQLLHELPFETGRGYSASVGVVSDKVFLAVKGAPEKVIDCCTHVLGTGDDAAEGGPDPLDAARLREVHRLVDRLAGEGLRVLAVAESALDDPPHDDTSVPQLVEKLTLLGFIAIADTPRATAERTVRRLTEAGIRVTMVTGDHPRTAAAVARGLGFPDADAVVTGAELDALPEPLRARKVARSTVFARVSPEQKARIIQDLQRVGRVVAMTGDGINDAAAIRLADVGIAVSAHGSASARAAADVILTDPDPQQIVAALLEGRTLWHSVRDAIGILVGGNAGEIAFTVLGTAVSGRAPLSTRQLLLVNMLTDMLPALAVAAAPHGSPEDLVQYKPSHSLRGSGLAHTLAVRGIATALGAAAAWQVGRMTGRAQRANTMGLVALVTTQLGQTFVTNWRSPLVMATCAVSIAVLAGVVQTPGVSQFFGCTPLGPFGWLTATGCSAAATAASAYAPRLAVLDPGAEDV